MAGGRGSGGSVGGPAPGPPTVLQLLDLRWQQLLAGAGAQGAPHGAASASPSKSTRPLVPVVAGRLRAAEWRCTAQWGSRERGCSGVRPEAAGARDCPMPAPATGAADGLLLACCNVCNCLGPAGQDSAHCRMGCFGPPGEPWEFVCRGLTAADLRQVASTPREPTTEVRERWGRRRPSSPA